MKGDKQMKTDERTFSRLMKAYNSRVYWTNYGGFSKAQLDRALDLILSGKADLKKKGDKIYAAVESQSKMNYVYHVYIHNYCSCEYKKHLPFNERIGKTCVHELVRDLLYDCYILRQQEQEKALAH